LVSLLALALLIVLAGCGGSKGKITGKLTKGGQPIKVGEQGQILLILVPDPATGNTYPCNLDKDTGTFDCIGNDGKGIPPGKYKVVVEATEGGPTGKDVLGGKYRMDATTKTIEVKAGQDIEINLD
jgi:hypothetical protein